MLEATVIRFSFLKNVDLIRVFGIVRGVEAARTLPLVQSLSKQVITRQAHVTTISKCRQCSERTYHSHEL